MLTFVLMNPGGHTRLTVHEAPTSVPFGQLLRLSSKMTDMLNGSVWHLSSSAVGMRCIVFSGV
jgi:hypothetical protein